MEWMRDSICIKRIHSRCCDSAVPCIALHKNETGSHVPYSICVLYCTTASKENNLKNSVDLTDSYSDALYSIHTFMHMPMCGVLYLSGHN